MRVSGLHLDYVSFAEYQAARWGDVLGIASFNGSAAGAPAALAEIPVAQVSTPVLPAAAQVCEVWRCAAPAESGRRARVSFRRTEDMLFGCIAVTESQASPPVPPHTHGSARGGAGSAHHEATTQVFREIC